MSKKRLILVTLMILLTLALTTTALAKNTKYTFNDVVIDSEVLEIEAGVKANNKNDYSNCSYFADDYAESLGYYADKEFAGDTADEVLDFCVDNFENRSR